MALRVLSEADKTFFEANGYLVVPNVVPKENLNAVIAASWRRFAPSVLRTQMPAVIGSKLNL